MKSYLVTAAAKAAGYCRVSRHVRYVAVVQCSARVISSLVLSRMTRHCQQSHQAGRAEGSSKLPVVAGKMTIHQHEGFVIGSCWGNNTWKFTKAGSRNYLTPETVCLQTGATSMLSRACRDAPTPQLVSRPSAARSQYQQVSRRISMNTKTSRQNRLSGTKSGYSARPFVTNCSYGRRSIKSLFPLFVTGTCAAPRRQREVTVTAAAVRWLPKSPASVLLWGLHNSQKPFHRCLAVEVASVRSCRRKPCFSMRHAR